MSTAPTPGWHPDPADPSQLRYWDGERWTERHAPRSPAAQQAPGYRPQTIVESDRKARYAQAPIAWVVALLTLGYMLPWAIAATRGKSNAGAIGLVNLLAGWTVIGWIIALVMACSAHQRFAITR